MNDKLTCDHCGRFVAYADLDSGEATRTMLTPDSEYTPETYLTLCPACKAKEAQP